MKPGPRGGLDLGSHQVVRWFSGAWSQTDLSPAIFQYFLGEVTSLNLSFLICSLEVIAVPTQEGVYRTVPAQLGTMPAVICDFLSSSSLSDGDSSTISPTLGRVGQVGEVCPPGSWLFRRIFFACE